MEALGGNHFDYGMGQFVLALAEVPVVVGFYQLRKRFKLDHLMIICAVFVRFVPLPRHLRPHRPC